MAQQPIPLYQLKARLQLKSESKRWVKKYMRLQTIHLIAALFCLALTSEAEENAIKLPGLTVDEGQLMLNGSPYRAMGANYFSLFYRTLKDPSDKSYDDGLKELSNAGIPFVRFMAGGFWPVDWGLYFRDKDKYFKRMDAVVRSAEKHHIGLIPSLFWNMATFPDLVGEPMDQFGNPKSETIAFIEQYTKEIVLRYRSSPAIWGWEFGNEYNLHVDLPNASSHRPKVVPHLKTGLKRTARDELSSQAMLTAFKHFAETARQHDKHRILITGNAIPRPHAYHNTKEKSWKKDTSAQFGNILLRDNPDLFNVISIHVYSNEGQGNTKSISETIALSQEISVRAGKPLFVGEFGASHARGADKEKALFIEILKAIETSKVPLSAFWVFDHAGQNKDWNTTFDNERSYMLNLVAASNQRMQQSRHVDKSTQQSPAGDVLKAAHEE